MIRRLTSTFENVTLLGTKTSYKNIFSYVMVSPETTKIYFLTYKHRSVLKSSQELERTNLKQIKQLTKKLIARHKHLNNDYPGVTSISRESTRCPYYPGELGLSNIIPGSLNASRPCSCNHFTLHCSYFILEYI